MIDLAVIPVAGRGIDLLPLTKSQPKEMLPVGRKPIVQYVVEELIHCRINRLLLVTSPEKTSVENHFDTNKQLIWHLRRNGKEDLLGELAFERAEAEYFYVRQRRQNGLGHAVLAAQPFVQQQRFVVALGDTILGRNQPSNIVKRMTEIFDRSGNDIKALIAFDEVPAEKVNQFGIAKPKQMQGDTFELEDLIEKPLVDQSPSTLAVAGRYVFSPEIFDFLCRTEPDKSGAVQLTDAIRLMIRSGKKVLGIRLPPGELRYDISNFESYYKAFLDFALHDPEHGNILIDWLTER
ncbi:MAG: UTP--glucose-1-phosphate uridylyltransferase [Planctomycetaceae bacterium]|jgi:UTP--glucose-1-phosphate uridylyltransferase|nr:UTP--glucose-1-phosphate uridylyltransferase [Planctomycetaceae bacterium]